MKTKNLEEIVKNQDSFRTLSIFSAIGYSIIKTCYYEKKFELLNRLQTKIKELDKIFSQNSEINKTYSTIKQISKIKKQEDFKNLLEGLQKNENILKIVVLANLVSEKDDWKNLKEFLDFYNKDQENKFYLQKLKDKLKINLSLIEGDEKLTVLLNLKTENNLMSITLLKEGLNYSLIYIDSEDDNSIEIESEVISEKCSSEYEQSININNLKSIIPKTLVSVKENLNKSLFKRSIDSGFLNSTVVDGFNQSFNQIKNDTKGNLIYFNKNEEFFCQYCKKSKSGSKMIKLNCTHSTCVQCLKEWFIEKLNEGINNQLYDKKKY